MTMSADISTALIAIMLAVVIAICYVDRREP